MPLFQPPIWVSSVQSEIARTRASRASCGCYCVFVCVHKIVYVRFLCVKTGEVPSVLQSHCLVWLCRGYGRRTLFSPLPPVKFVTRSSSASQWHELRLVPAGKLRHFLTHLSIAHRAGAWRWRGQPCCFTVHVFNCCWCCQSHWLDKTEASKAQYFTKRKSMEITNLIVFFLLFAYFADKVPPE